MTLRERVCLLLRRLAGNNPTTPEGSACLDSNPACGLAPVLV